MSPPQQSYTAPVILAILLHMVLAIFLLVKLTTTPQMPSQSPTEIVQAVAIDQNTLNQQMAASAAAKQLEIQQTQEQQQKLAQAEQAKLAAQQQQIEQAKILEEKKLAQQHLEQQKLEQTKIAQQQAAAAAEKLAQTKAAQTAARKALKQHLLEEQAKELSSVQQNIKTIQKKQAKLATQKQQQLLQAGLQQQLSQESKTLKTSTAAASANNSAELDKYKALIIQAISQEWIIPEDVDPNSTSILLVSVAPDGVVLSITIAQSSGNSLLDRSAKTAVLRASPLPVPKDSALFANFRSLRLIVKPEGIQNL